MTEQHNPQPQPQSGGQPPPNTPAASTAMGDDDRVPRIAEEIIALNNEELQQLVEYLDNRGIRHSVVLTRFKP